MNDKSINEYQKEAYNQSHGFSFFEHFRETMDEAVRNKSHLKILDIGCGNGSILEALLDIYEDKVECVGIDSSRYDSWDKLDTRITLYQLSAFELEKQFQENEFDIIICSGLIHHLIYPSRKKTITCGRVYSGELPKWMVYNLCSFLSH